MPKLGLTMTEGIVADWIVQPGETFDINDAVFVVETDKVANEIPAEAAGTLQEIVVPVGNTVPVGTVLAYWEDGQEGDLPAPRKAGAGQPASCPEIAPAPSVRCDNRPQPGETSGRVKASPLARRLAKQKGIALVDLQGSGPKGRIVARDVEAAKVHPAPASHEQPVPSDAHIERVTPSSIQTTIARRLTQGKQDTPHFYLTLDVEVSRLVELRREINESDDGPRLTLNHFVVLAVARALRSIPLANRVWTADGILAFGRIDVGVAISTERGLMAPAVCDVGDASIVELARRLDAVTSRARSGTLLPQDNGTPAITVSNAGMHNVTYMTSIINPGQAMILGVGSIKDVFRPDASGQPVLRREMGLVLSADHRITDGVAALNFLNAIARLLERPARLLAS
jgi:pyruvate dehydrogenase E2 component (dihydrolipoamide acetyltransferase)